jgi:hypothetical protein
MAVLAQLKQEPNLDSTNIIQSIYIYSAVIGRDKGEENQGSASSEMGRSLADGKMLERVDKLCWKETS